MNIIFHFFLLMAAPMNEKPTPVLIEVQQNKNVGIKRKLNLKLPSKQDENSCSDANEIHTRQDWRTAMTKMQVEFTSTVVH